MTDEPRTPPGAWRRRTREVPPDQFDRHFVGLRPDLTLAVRPDLLAEEDGPTLVHGIQSLHGQRIGLPRSLSQRPDLLLVKARYAEFEAHAEKAS